MNMTETRIREILQAMDSGEASLFIQPFELKHALEELIALRGEVAQQEVQILRGYGQVVLADQLAIMRGLA
jgi:hypothetical protein